MKEYAKQLARRKSVRKYDESLSVSAEEMRKIQKQIPLLKSLCDGIKVEIEITERKNTNCKWNAQYCVLCYSEEKPRWRENAGYMLEQLDLFLASLDIGCCWYGWGKCPQEKEGMKFAIMMCFGKCRKEDFRTKKDEFLRNGVEKMYKGLHGEELSDAFLAPSACNSQPWRVEQTDNVIKVFRLKSTLNPLSRVLAAHFNKIDMGIFLVFLETVLEEKSIEFCRETVKERKENPELVAVYTLR